MQNKQEGLRYQNVYLFMIHKLVEHKRVVPKASVPRRTI